MRPGVEISWLGRWIEVRKESACCSRTRTPLSTAPVGVSVAASPGPSLGGARGSSSPVAPARRSRQSPPTSRPLAGRRRWPNSTPSTSTQSTSTPRPWRLGSAASTCPSTSSRGDVQGIPLVDMTTVDFVRPITTGITANFITARAAARRMIEQGSGVILALDSGSAYGSPMMGSTGPADAATDTFIRNLATEVGPQGVRVVGIWTAGLPETFSREKLAAVDSKFQDEAAFQGLIESLDQMRMTRRSPRLAEVAAAAAFLASEKAGAITGTFVNVTSGTFPS